MEHQASMDFRELKVNQVFQAHLVVLVCKVLKENVVLMDIQVLPELKVLQVYQVYQAHQVFLAQQVFQV